MTKYLPIMMIGAFLLGMALSPALAETPRHLFALSYDDAETAVAQALAERDPGHKLAAAINGRKTAEPLLSYDRPISVEIRGLSFDKPSRRWNANLVALAEGEVITAIPLSGRFEEIVEVPVLKRQLRAGDTIKESDVEMRDFRLAHVRAGTLTDMAELIGKSPLRVISAFRPIREREIAAPAVVKKNGIVRMRYVSPGMEITSTGQAMSEGARGEMIAVRNMASRKIVRAVVEDDKTVVVAASEMQTSQLTGASDHETN